MAADPEQLHLTNAQLKTFSILIATLINKLQKEGGLSSSALQLKDEEFLKWLQQNMSSKELNRIIFGQYCQYGGADLDKYDELFVNRQNGTAILDYILSMDFLASVAVYAIAQKKGEEAKKPYFPETLGLSEVDKDDIISFCVQCTDERKYPDLVTEQQYKDFLNNIRNALCYRFAELEINSLKAKTFEAKTSQLQDHIRITMNTMTAGSYEIKPIFNKTVNYWVNGDKKSKVLPSLLAEYYSTLSTLLKRYGSKPQITEADHQEFITEVSKYIKKFEEEFNSDKGGFFDNSAHYAWHMQHIQRLQKLGLWSQVPLPQPENEKEEAALPLDLSIGDEEAKETPSMDEAQLLKNLIDFYIEKGMVEQEATEAAKEALEKRKQSIVKIQAALPSSEPSDSSSASKYNPESAAESAFALAIKNALLARQGKRKETNDTNSDKQVDEDVAKFVENNRGITLSSVKEGREALKKGSTAAILIPRAIKYTAIDSRDRDLPEEVTLHILPTQPDEEQLASLCNGYILTGHEKPVRARLYHLHEGQLVECHPGKLDALCSYVTESLKEKKAPLNLDRQQYRKLIIETCGGHNYKKMPSIAPTSVAESSSSSSQASVPVAESSSSSTRTPSPTAAQQNSLPSISSAPAPIGNVDRKPSLGVSQGAPAKKYNFDGYEVTLLKKGESLPEDAAIQERMLYAKWDSNTKELTVKFKQGEGTPISFPMKISNPTNIKLLTETLENPDNTNWEKVKGFITFRTEDPDMGQRNSVAFRRPPQVLGQSNRRSVSPEKAKEPVGDGSKEKGKEGATENPRIVSVSPLSFLPPIEEKKEPTGDNSKDKVKLSDSPRVSFMPPPVEKEKEGPTPPDDTQNKASSMGLRSSKE